MIAGIAAVKDSKVLRQEILSDSFALFSVSTYNKGDQDLPCTVCLK